MDNRRNKNINYAELFRAISEHWKPLIQDKQFYWAMLKWLICMSAFTAFMIFGLSLNPTGKALGELLKEIEPPPGAVKMEVGGLRKGVDCLYKFPGMNGEELRSYYKMELKKKLEV